MSAQTNQCSRTSVGLLRLWAGTTPPLPFDHLEESAPFDRAFVQSKYAAAKGVNFDRRAQHRMAPAIQSSAHNPSGPKQTKGKCLAQALDITESVAACFDFLYQRNEPAWHGSDKSGNGGAYLAKAATDSASQQMNRMGESAAARQQSTARIGVFCKPYLCLERRGEGGAEWWPPVKFRLSKLRPAAADNTRPASCSMIPEHESIQARNTRVYPPKPPLTDIA